MVVSKLVSTLEKRWTDQCPGPAGLGTALIDNPELDLIILRVLMQSAHPHIRISYNHTIHSTQATKTLRSGLTLPPVPWLPLRTVHNTMAPSSSRAAIPILTSSLVMCFRPLLGWSSLLPNGRE